MDSCEKGTNPVPKTIANPKKEYQRRQGSKQQPVHYLLTNTGSAKVKRAKVALDHST